MLNQHLFTPFPALKQVPSSFATCQIGRIGFNEVQAIGPLAVSGSVAA